MVWSTNWNTEVTKTVVYYSWIKWIKDEIDIISSTSTVIRLHLTRRQCKWSLISSHTVVIEKFLQHKITINTSESKYWKFWWKTRDVPAAPSWNPGDVNKLTFLGRPIACMCGKLSMCMILVQRGLLLGNPFLSLNVEPELSILVSHLMTELPFNVQYLSTLCQSLISIHIRKSCKSFLRQVYHHLRPLC